MSKDKRENFQEPLIGYCLSFGLCQVFFVVLLSKCPVYFAGCDLAKIISLSAIVALRERLRTLKVFTKDQCFYLNYHKFSIKSYVLDVY